MSWSSQLHQRATSHTSLYSKLMLVTQLQAELPSTIKLTLKVVQVVLKSPEITV